MEFREERDLGVHGVGRISPLKADLLLVLVTLIWGGTFPVLKTLVSVLPPLYLVGLRFLIAFVILTPFAAGKSKSLNRRTLSSGITLGFLIWGSFITQTVGIQYTTASKAAFITALCVVLTPILSSVMLRKPPGRAALVGVVTATVGLTLLTVDFAEPFVLQKGDLWVLACAWLCAFQIIAVDRFGAWADPLLLTWVQTGTVAAVSLAGALLTTPLPRLTQGVEWACLGYLAVFATAGCQYLQIRVQPSSTPTRASLIFSLEPVFASILAFLFLGERLPLSGQVGAALMLMGVLVSELGHKEEDLEKHLYPATEAPKLGASN